MLVRWNPFSELVKFDRIFDDFFLNPVSWKPVIDVFEDKDKITLEAEIPGIDPKDVSIDVDKNTLTIRGEKLEKKKRDGFKSGSFSRSFTLPNLIDAENISASYDKGIITILVPKKSEGVARQIEIKNTG